MPNTWVLVALAVLAVLALLEMAHAKREGYANEPEEGLTLRSGDKFVFAASATGPDLEAKPMGQESKPMIAARDWDFAPVKGKANTYTVSTAFGGTTRRFLSSDKSKWGKITLADGTPIEFLVTGRGKTADANKQQIVRLKAVWNDTYAMTLGGSESEGASTLGWKKNDMNDTAQDWILPKGVDLTAPVPDKAAGSKPPATPAAAAKAATAAAAAKAEEKISGKAASSENRPKNTAQKTLENVVLVNRFALRAGTRKDTVLTGGTTAAGTALNSVDVAAPRDDDIGQSWELVPARNPSTNAALNNATYKIRLGKPDRTKTDVLTAKIDGSGVILANDVSDNSDVRQIWVATEMNSPNKTQIVTFKLWGGIPFPAFLSLTVDAAGQWGVGLEKVPPGTPSNTNVKSHWLLDSTDDAVTPEIETYQPPQPVGAPSAPTVGAPSAPTVRAPSAQPVGAPSAQPVGAPSAQRAANAGASDGGLSQLVVKDSAGKILFNAARNDASARFIQLQSGIKCDVNPDVDTEYEETKEKKLTLAQLTASLSAAKAAQSAQGQALDELRAKIEKNNGIVSDLKLQ
jgi:hypothetical protein